MQIKTILIFVYLIVFQAIALTSAKEAANKNADPLFGKIRDAIKPVELKNTEDISIIYDVPHVDLNMKIEQILPDKDIKLSKKDAQILEKEADNVEYLLDKAYSAARLGSIETALFYYGRALKIEPDNINALFSVGSLYQKLRDYPKARKVYERVLELDPKNETTLNNYLALIADDNPNSALSKLYALERVNPNYSPVKEQLGLVLMKLGQISAAEKYLQKAAAMSPNIPHYKYNLALFYDKLEQYKLALAYYKEALHLYDNSVQLSLKIKIQHRIGDIMSELQQSKMRTYTAPNDSDLEQSNSD